MGAGKGEEVGNQNSSRRFWTHWHRGRRRDGKVPQTIEIYPSRGCCQPSVMGEGGAYPSPILFSAFPLLGGSYLLTLGPSWGLAVWVLGDRPIWKGPHRNLLFSLDARDSSKHPKTPRRKQETLGTAFLLGSLDDRGMQLSGQGKPAGGVPERALNRTGHPL